MSYDDLDCKLPSPAAFDEFREKLKFSAIRLNKAQLLTLADDLHDEVRRRRGRPAQDLAVTARSDRALNLG